MIHDALKITRTGVTINATTASLTPTPLPVNEAGENPRAVRVMADTGVVYVKVGPGSLTAGGLLTVTLNDVMVGQFPLLLNTRGDGLINVLTRAGTANLNVVPVEV